MSRKRKKATKNPHTADQKNEQSKEKTEYRHVYVEPDVQIDITQKLRAEYWVERAEDKATQKKQLNWTIVTAGLVFAYTLASFLQGYYTYMAVGVADRSARTAQTQLEMSERPWVDANISLDGALTFNENGASIPLKIGLRNTGRSPAVSAHISPLLLIGVKGANAATYREEVCKDAARITTTMPQFGMTLFPNVNFEQPTSVGIGKEEIENSKASKEFPSSKFGDVILSPSIVICIAYRPTFNKTSIYHTAYIVDLLKRDSANRLGVAFKIGEDVDPKHLLLRIHPIDPVYAD